jgi:hypothetical protein
MVTATFRSRTRAAPVVPRVSTAIEPLHPKAVTFTAVRVLPDEVRLHGAVR